MARDIVETRVDRPGVVRPRRAATWLALAVWLAAAPGGCAEPPSGSVSIGGDPGGAPMEPSLVEDSAFGEYLAGRQAERRFDFEAAASMMRQALDKDPDNGELKHRAFVLMLTEGNEAQALALAKSLAADQPGSPLPTVTLAAGALKDGRYDEAARLFESLEAKRYNAFLRPVGLAWARLGLGDVDGALAALEPMRGERGFGTLYDMHATLIRDLGKRDDDAAVGYREMLERQRSLRTVQLGGNWLARHGKVAEARAAYDEFRAKSPETGMLLPETATADPAPLVPNAKAGFAEALFNLAGALSEDRDAGIALVYGRMAVDLWPASGVAQLLVAEVLEGQERDDDAIAVYRGVVKDPSVGWTARLRLARALNRLEQTDASIAELRQMAAEEPKRAEPLIVIGDIQRAKDRFAEAVTAYDDAAARVGTIDARNWRLLYSRGIALERSKQWERAEADFQKALELQPEQPYVLNYLGYSWVDRGMNLDKAEGMIRRATELRPEDGYIADSLGWVYYRTNRFREAVTELERAVSLEPEDPILNDHLGDAYWKVGRKAEARYQWQRALRQKPETDRVSAIESKISCGDESCAARKGG